MRYFVSRQCYWPEGINVVEVAIGGLDYANPDMLSPRFKTLGEGCEYLDPREAVEAAKRVLEAWRTTVPAAEIAVGATGGFTAPFEPVTAEHAEAWAEKAYGKLPKCSECGGLLEKTTYHHDYSDEPFCSGRCADASYQKEFVLNQQPEEDV